MKKIFSLMCIIYAINILSFGSPAVHPADERAQASGTLALTLFVGNRGVSDESFEEVYGKINISPGLDMALLLSKTLEIFFHTDFLSIKGETSFTGDRTNLTIFPLELGLRLKFKHGLFLPYLGGGAGYYFFNEESTFDKRNYIHRVNSFGYFAETGIRVKIVKKWHLDLKVKFTSFKINPDEPEESDGRIVYSGERDLKGFTFALGFGVSI